MEARLARARALVFIGENETLYAEIKSHERTNMKNVIIETTPTATASTATVPAAAEQVTEEPAAEVKKPVKLLDNPLPLPKPHVAKEMDYQIDTEDDMDFDFDIKDDDDFDV